MNLKRGELIITVIAMVILLVGVLSSTVFADSLTLSDLLNNSSNNVNTENTQNAENKIQQIITPVNNANNNSNSAAEFNKAGLEDLPVLAFVGCAIVAVFAFKKIKEYKAY